MAAVNWTDPSEGLVIDPKPSLTLENRKGGALLTRSRGIGVFAVTPNNLAVGGGTQGAALPAVAGACIANPASPNALDGIGVLGATDRPAAIGVSGVALGVRSIGVIGRAENASVGVVGRGGVAGVEGFSRDGNGVSGITQSIGSDAGVYGYGAGDRGAGVRGVGVAGAGVEAHSTAGPGVIGSSDGAQGVVGEAVASNAAGVFGRNDASSGVGLDGYSKAGTAVRATASGGTAVLADSWSGTALKANRMTGSGPAADVYCLTSGALEAKTGGGVAVDAFSISKAAVFAASLSSPGADPKSGVGVHGAVLSSGAGIKGTTFSGVGVHGVGLPVLGAWAGLFEGNVFIKGVLMKYASYFSIDHPLDPERKVLNHASVEAPEHKTFYDGVVALDKNGRARVQLPRWFSALNGNLRYQLTPIGGAAPGLHVRRPTKDSFTVAGGAAGQRVCWQVTGVRRDAWARANPLRVEQPRKSARPPHVPATAAGLKRFRDSLRTSGEELRERGQRLRQEARERRVPTRLRRPAIQKEPVSVRAQAVEAQARATIRSARRALRKKV